MARAIDADILIAGGGIVGLTLGLALKKADPSLSVILVDRDVPGVAPRDKRASAIAAAARRMLETLGVWPVVADAAQPIREMIVTDSRASDVVRPVFLTFDGALEDGAPFAHMVPNGLLRQALEEAAETAGVRLLRPDGVERYRTEPSRSEVDLTSGGSLSASLLVAADGLRSRLRDQAGIRTMAWSYRQVGLVATIAHSRPHCGRAEEHFLPSGPFAVLPLQGNFSSLVWTEPAEAAKRLAESDAPTLNEEIRQRIGNHLGIITIEGRVQSFLLGLRIAREFVRPRFCLIGDAAHAIHPLAGQGLNLGFRDVAALAETLVDANRLGLDLGGSGVIERYQQWRRFDTMEMGVLTDGLSRLFSNDNSVLRFARDIGLGVVDRLPKLKAAMIRQAAGEGTGIPRLLAGEMP